MIGTIHEVSEAIEAAPQYFSIAGLALSVAGLAYGFFTSVPTCLIFTFFSISFAISYFREQNQEGLREMHAQITERVQQLGAETDRLEGEINTLHEANDHLEDNVQQLHEVRAQLQQTRWLLNYEVGRLHHVQEQLTGTVYAVNYLANARIAQMHGAPLPPLPQQVAQQLLIAYYPTVPQHP